MYIAYESEERRGVRPYGVAGAAARWAAILLLAGCAAQAGADADDWRGTLLPEPIAKPDFTLLDTKGEPFDFKARTEGTLTLLFFGYTNCPDVCPIHMSALASVLSNLPFEMKNRTRVVFVTTDPERDTPERIREWLDRFDPEFIGLRGDSAAVAAIQNSLRLPTAVRGPADERGNYTVGHSAQVLAFTPDNLAHLAYSFGTRQQDWAHDLPRLLEAEW